MGVAAGGTWQPAKGGKAARLITVSMFGSGRRGIAFPQRGTSKKKLRHEADGLRSYRRITSDKEKSGPPHLVPITG